jgi:hypothetical protein
MSGVVIAVVDVKGAAVGAAFDLLIRLNDGSKMWGK